VLWLVVSLLRLLSSCRVSADADGDGVVDIGSQGLGGWVVDEADAGCPEVLDLVRSLGGRCDLRLATLRTALHSAVREVAAALLEDGQCSRSFKMRM
jgi:hypothetical protein